MGVPFAFEWEIYVEPQAREYFAEKARSLASGKRMSEDAIAYFLTQEDSLVQVGDVNRGSGRVLRGRRGLRRRGELMPESQEDAQSCLKQFNPQSEAETRAVVDNW